MRTETGLYIVHSGKIVSVYTEDEWYKIQHLVWWDNVKKIFRWEK